MNLQAWLSGALWAINIIFIVLNLRIVLPASNNVAHSKLPAIL